MLRVSLRCMDKCNFNGHAYILSPIYTLIVPRTAGFYIYRHFYFLQWHITHPPQLIVNTTITCQISQVWSLTTCPNSTNGAVREYVHWFATTGQE